MAISITIQNYLEDLGINYSPLAHDHTATSSMTAETIRGKPMQLYIGDPMPE